MKFWLSLIISLPTENANTRMRTWRALKASGAAVLRDGVYLMPERDAWRATFQAVAAEVSSAGGTSYVIRIEEPKIRGKLYKVSRIIARCTTRTQAEALVEMNTLSYQSTPRHQIRKLGRRIVNQ